MCYVNNNLSNANSQITQLYSDLNKYETITHGKLENGNAGSVDGYWHKCGHLVILTGCISNLTLTSSGWTSLTQMPYLKSGTYAYRPLVGVTGSNLIARDGSLGIATLDAWLPVEDNGKYLYFQTCYFTEQ